jgi:hypothetical protein
MGGHLAADQSQRLPGGEGGDTVGQPHGGQGAEPPLLAVPPHGECPLEIDSSPFEMAGVDAQLSGIQQVAQPVHAGGGRLRLVLGDDRGQLGLLPGCQLLRRLQGATAEAQLAFTPSPVGDRDPEHERRLKQTPEVAVDVEQGPESVDPDTGGLEGGVDLSALACLHDQLGDDIQVPGVQVLSSN